MLGKSCIDIDIKIINQKLQNLLPSYATNGSAGLDLLAAIDNDLIIEPQQSILIPTGIAIYIKQNNLCGMILPRSGLGHKHGIILGNSVGLIDADYQGELLVSLWNRTNVPYTIAPLAKIAQLVILPILHAQFHIVDTFNASIRGTGGFGSTGN